MKQAAITVTLSRKQASFLAEMLANGVSNFIYRDIPHDGTPESILAAWRKEDALCRKNPFRGRLNGPRTHEARLEAEEDREAVGLEARILAKVIAAIPA